MMTRFLKTVLPAVFGLILLMPGQAHARISFHEVPWGMVKVDLNLDGESDLVMHNWPEDDLTRERVQVQFMIFDSESEDGLRSVKIEDKEKPMFLLPVHEEGTCRTYDFALMATGKTRDTRRFDMIYMTRSDVVDAEGNGAVTFAHYRLEKDLESAETEGGNPYIYNKVDEYVAPEVYCDVKVAFKENLETLKEEFEDGELPKKEDKKEEKMEAPSE